MAITSRDDLLFHWDQRVLPGAQAIIGGDPSYDCDTARAFVGQDRKIRYANPDRPVVEYEEINGVTRPVMPLALARTNLMGFSRDYSQWTFNATAFLSSSNNPDPAGGAEASLLGTGATGGSGLQRNTNSLTGDGVKSVGILLKAGSAAAPRIALYDITFGFRHQISVTWNGTEAPTLTTTSGAGTKFPPVPLVDGWWWTSFTATGVVAANTHRLYIYPGGGSGTGSVYAFDAQVEDGAFPTFPIHTPTSAAVARAVETLSFANPPSPQAMVIFFEFIEGGTILNSGNSNLFTLGDTSSGDRYQIYSDESNGRYRTWLGSIGTAFTSAPNIRERVQIAAVFPGTGSQTIRALQRIEDGAIEATSNVRTVPTVWNAQELWLNSISTASVGAVGAHRLTMVKLSAITAATDGTEDEALMDELAAVITDKHGNPL